MRSLSLVALIIGLFVFSSGAVTGQGKDKDKDPKKDPSGKVPTEVAGKDLDQWVKDLADPDPSARQAAVRALVPFMEQDRPVGRDIEIVSNAIAEGRVGRVES